VGGEGGFLGGRRGLAVLLGFVALVFPVGDAVLEFVAGDGAADYADDGWTCVNIYLVGKKGDGGYAYCRACCGLPCRRGRGRRRLRLDRRRWRRGRPAHRPGRQVGIPAGRGIAGLLGDIVAGDIAAAGTGVGDTAVAGCRCSTMRPPPVEDPEDGHQEDNRGCCRQSDSW
jgi:hypothetical protein